MRLRIIVFFALFAFVLGGCASKNTISNYGNFIPPSAVVDQEKIADDVAQQLAAMYPPALTALELKQPAPDPFGQALVRLLRNKGYSLMEFVQPKENDQSATAPQTDTATAGGNQNVAAQQPNTPVAGGNQNVAAQQANTPAVGGNQNLSTKPSNVSTVGKEKVSKKKQRNRKRSGTPVEEEPPQPIVPPPPPQRLALQYVLDQVDTDLYCLILKVGDQSISRVYSANGMPAGSWVRKE